MARKFLIFVAVIILLVITGRVLWEQYGDDLIKAAFIPDHEFDASKTPPAPDYTRAEAWAARPETDNGAKMQPANLDGAAPLDVDVFFIHPTTYLNNNGWNAAIDEETSADTVDEAIMKGQASAFNAAGHIYAPRYRQATLGAFLAADQNAFQAFVTAYNDVRDAFDQFIQDRDGNRPFIIAGHSQGALHGLALLRDRIANGPLKEQMVAAYLIGWPVSVEADLKAMGLAPCEDASGTGCVLSWQSFAPDGDASEILTAYNSLPGVLGAPRAGTEMLCTNPLSWLRVSTPVNAAENPGAVAYPEDTGALGEITPEFVGARCGDDGILYLSDAPGAPFDTYLMPGNNYHVYDISLFYMSIANNARLRAQAFISQ